MGQCAAYGGLPLFCSLKQNTLQRPTTNLSAIYFPALAITKKMSFEVYLNQSMTSDVVPSWRGPGQPNLLMFYFTWTSLRKTQVLWLSRICHYAFLAHTCSPTNRYKLHLSVVPVISKGIIFEEGDKLQQKHYNTSIIHNVLKKKCFENEPPSDIFCWV